jgi:hypothetical protein
LWIVGECTDDAFQQFVEANQLATDHGPEWLNEQAGHLPPEFSGKVIFRPGDSIVLGGLCGGRQFTVIGARSKESGRFLLRVLVYTARQSPHRPDVCLPAGAAGGRVVEANRVHNRLCACQRARFAAPAYRVGRGQRLAVLQMAQPRQRRHVPACGVSRRNGRKIAPSRGAAISRRHPLSPSVPKKMSPLSGAWQ